MGATGSHCSCIERWWVLSDSTSIQERISVLERKHSAMETNDNTLHTKYSTLETKYEQLHKKLAAALTEIETLQTRMALMEAKATNMLFTQEEMDCDMVVIQ